MCYNCFALKNTFTESETAENKKCLFIDHQGLAIMPHLLCWQGFGIYQYAGTLAALHLHQTDAMQNSGNSFLRAF